MYTCLNFIVSDFWEKYLILYKKYRNWLKPLLVLDCEWLRDTIKNNYV